MVTARKNRRATTLGLLPPGGWGLRGGLRGLLITCQAGDLIYANSCYNCDEMTPTKRKAGRPPHVDDPPVLLSTSIPTSVDRTLRELSAVLGRPRSELLADAIRAYARKYADIKSIRNILTGRRK
jgi:hypothetical protein